MKKIVVISCSYRSGSNSDILADEFINGARSSGNEVTKINLKDKNINFCKGCLACQKTGKCVINDDVFEIINQVKNSDVIVFSTPIYFYEMSGQMKTLLDRLNPLYNQSYNFRDVYLITSAIDTDKSTMKKAISGLEGWISCFENTCLKGVIEGFGLDNTNEVLTNELLLKDAYELGKNC